ncbi:protein WHAT'S THIS FACTOR 1 homolog [Cynara cardunculus var. scolymus]|uniref:protein WHAT'S THIS FACTOR 1 homolog n=1 Tax=Cynara cardunculus var. scolymus TaxID=59895 RepID=UPI000D62927A|nr:protein WHAT'S THIS FACTOR 1 homolog [Cynara cardunculus var. scolymus]
MSNQLIKPPTNFTKLFKNLYYVASHLRLMTTSRRVQDRSQKKRVHALEVAVEKHKIASKILFLLELLKHEPEQIIPIRSLDQHRRPLNLPKPHKISDFIRKSPKLFELYKDQRGTTWVGLTKKGEELIEEEERLIGDNEEKAVEHVTRLLMMSVEKILPLDKIAHFRRDLGLPYDFRKQLVHKYPDIFQVLKNEDDVEFLKLVSWNPSWSVTELEKKVLGITKADDHVPGMLSLPFPMKFPPDYKKVYRYGGQIENFQKREYLSPYADAKELKAGSVEFDKRAIAVMHEVLSFMNEKQLVTDHLTHFRREFVMPQKLMRILLKHFGIFYVSERGKRFRVFLTEAYDGSELIEKSPLVVWKEKVVNLTGYRGRKKKIETFDDLPDLEDDDLFESESEDDNVIRIDQSFKEEGTMSDLEDELLPQCSEMEMEIGEVQKAYKDK